MKRILGIITLLAFIFSPASAFAQKNSNILQIKGSDTMVNAAQKLAEEFMKVHPEVYVAVTGGGSGVGIASLINKTCSIATASREIKPKEIEAAKKNGVDPKIIVVANDGVALLVNKNNPVSKLTIQQLHDIYTEKITNWKDLGGKDAKITLLSREVSSGTHVYFKEEVLQLGNSENKGEFPSDVLLMSSSQAIVEEVAQNENAIGYLGMGYVSNKTKTIELSKDNTDYYLPDVASVLSHKYPLSRPLYMLIDGEAKGNIKTFIDYVLSSDGQKQFKETGFVPLQ
jgi:phosphate transport system substrate-binding protein